MSLISVNYPLIIEPYRHARNALLPDSAFYSDCHAALNHALVYRGSEVFRRSNLLGYTRASGTNTVWRWRFRSGYGQTKLHCVGIAGLASASAANPYITINVTLSGGATQTLTVYNGNTDATPSDGPSELTSFEHTFDIDPASVYECTAVTVDYGALLALSCFAHGDPEIDDTVNYFTEHEPAGTHPIYDTNQQRLIEGGGRLLRRNRGLHTNWCLYDGAARTRTSATYINLIDNSSATPPTSTSPGYRFVTTARNTSSRTTIPVEVAVYGATQVGGSGTVVLRDTSGTDAVTVTLTNSVDAWVVGTGTISVGTGQKYDLMYAGDGANQLQVRSVHVAEYEA